MSEHDDTQGLRARAAGERTLLTVLQHPSMLDFDDADARVAAALLRAVRHVPARRRRRGRGRRRRDVSHGAISRPAAVVSPGLTVLAIILFMGAVSGAHLNPVVTISFTLRGDFPWRRAPAYIVTQLAGATLAVLFLKAVFGDAGALGATVPGPHIHDWQAMLIELLLTLGLVSTILGTASRAQNVGALSAVAVGGYIALAGLWASPISGAVDEPGAHVRPRSRAAATSAHFWVYVVGPLAGGLLAVAFAWILRGPGGDAGGLAAARGMLDQRVQEALGLRPGRGLDG